MDACVKLANRFENLGPARWEQSFSVTLHGNAYRCGRTTDEGQEEKDLEYSDAIQVAASRLSYSFYNRVASRDSWSQ